MSATATQEIFQFWDSNWWWLIWFAPAVIGGCLEGVRDFIFECLRIVTGNYQALDTKKPKSGKSKKKRSQTLATSQPVLVPCLHNRAVQVRDGDPLNGKRVAWYCPECDEQLPASWALTMDELNGG
jgi:hypothetical protein